MNTVTKTEKAKQAVSRPEESPKQYVSPDVNIYETEQDYVLEAEMPGVTKEQIEITLEANSLTLVGNRSDQDPQGDLLYRESRPIIFRRVFELDPAIDASKIRAQMEQGVLTLVLPKTAAVQPRRIAVE